MPTYKCPKCGSYPEDQAGLCYSCKAQEYFDGKTDINGNNLNITISIEEYRKLKKLQQRKNGKIK